MSTLKKCQKCSGTGKVGFQVDNGVCYKCEGSGFTGGTSEEIAAAVEARELKNLKAKALKGICNFFKKDELWVVAIETMKAATGEQVLNVPASWANVFEIPYTDNYSAICNVENQTEWGAKYAAMLSGKSCVISKVSDKQVKISFN